MVPIFTEFFNNRFFLRDYIKDNAYRNNPRNVDELKTSMSNIMNDISPMALQAVSTDMLLRARLCMLVHTFIPFCNKIYCKRLTLNKVLTKKISISRVRVSSKWP
jgi:hypothetical protein